MKNFFYRSVLRCWLSRMLAATVMLSLALWCFGSEYALGQLVFIFTYALAALGVVLIVGQCGQISLTHGALLGLGAYAQTLLMLQGWPAVAALVAAMSVGMLGGWLASLPARRLSGLHFALGTLAFGLLVEEALIRWEKVTRGAAGLAVPPLHIGGWQVDAPAEQLAVSAAVFIVALYCCWRWCRCGTGRRWRAVRDDEAAAQGCGIDSARVKGQAFIAGGALAGVAGGLYAHWIGFVSPEQFGTLLSFELLMLAFIGGVDRLAGALWGALIVVAIPQFIAVARDLLPAGFGNPAGFERLAFGAVIVAVVLWRPQGIATKR